VVAEVFRLVTSNLQFVNVGGGLSLRVMSDYTKHQREIGITFMCAVLLLATIGGSYALLRSRYGLALTAMRDNPVAAAS
jgi:branched-chain amino acid transport system permease protein